MQTVLRLDCEWFVCVSILTRAIDVVHATTSTTLVPLGSRLSQARRFVVSIVVLQIIPVYPKFFVLIFPSPHGTITIATKQETFSLGSPWSLRHY